MKKFKVKATYYEDENKIVWKWDYTDNWQSYVDRAKRIPGARFWKEEKAWRAPASIDVCHMLREEYGDELDIRPSLREWYLANKQDHDRQIAGSAATDAELVRLPTVAPRLFATLRPDQRAGIRWIADTYRQGGLVADKPGLGKTLQVIGGVLEADVRGPILVVAPKISVRSVWQREIRRWTDEDVFIARGTRAKREAALRRFWEHDPGDKSRKWLVINQDMLRVKRKPNDTEVKANAKRRGRIEGFEYPQLFENIWPWSVIVADESHQLLGSLTVAKSNLKGEGLAKLPTTDSTRRYAMSGTPFGRGGRIHGMFGTLHWLWPDEYTSFWKWADRHFEIEEEYIGRGKTAKKIVGLRGGQTAEGFMKSLGPRILRRTKEEVLKDLPPKQYVEVVCEMEPAQKKQYKMLGDDAEISVPGGTIIANGVLAEITRARQIANGVLMKDGDDVHFAGESCKMDALVGKLEERGIMDGTGDTKVIVSSRFNDFIHQVIIPRLEKEGVEYHLLTGATSDKKREAAMEKFQGEGGPRVFILNSKAGGVSITLDAADEVHCIDELDNPEDNEQLEDRAHRASRIHQVTIFYYRTEGTYDVNIANNVEDKRKAQFEVLDGRRGLEDVRKWIKYDATQEED